MSETIRFPLLAPGNGMPTEAGQVITLMGGGPVAQLPQGGAVPYTDLTPWKLDQYTTETPFPCVVIEFEGNGAFTIGNGTTPIGLYGGIVDPATGLEFKTLLGILGVNITGTTVPVIPLDSIGGAGLIFVGYSQKISDVALYDTLSVGGVGAAINLAEGDEVTIRVRPIRRRSWMG